MDVNSYYQTLAVITAIQRGLKTTRLSDEFRETRKFCWLFSLENYSDGATED